MDFPLKKGRHNGEREICRVTPCQRWSSRSSDADPCVRDQFASHARGGEMKSQLLFLLLLNVDKFCASQQFSGESDFFAELNPRNLGRPTKVIIDEIITRSVTFPTKQGLAENFPRAVLAENYPQSDFAENYPQSDFEENFLPTDFAAKKYPKADFMLTNRRRDDSSDNSGNSFQLEGVCVPIYV
jgi:hypothetical protein